MTQPQKIGGAKHRNQKTKKRRQAKNRRTKSRKHRRSMRVRRRNIPTLYVIENEREHFVSPRIISIQSPPPQQQIVNPINSSQTPSPLSISDLAHPTQQSLSPMTHTTEIHSQPSIPSQMMELQSQASSEPASLHLSELQVTPVTVDSLASGKTSLESLSR
jgi:hypothetical protein